MVKPHTDVVLHLLDTFHKAQQITDSIEIDAYRAHCTGRYIEGRAPYDVWLGDDYLGERPSLLDTIMFILEHMTENR